MLRLLVLLFGLPLKLLSSERCAAVLTRLAHDRYRSLSPEEGARFLMDLDVRLYHHHGMAASRYGSGTHTKHRHTGYHEFFVERIPEGSTVVDIGCGKGELAHDVASRCGASVTGIDLVEKNIATASERHSHPDLTYTVGDATQDLPRGQFDTVILSNVLEHIEHRPEFLKKIRDALSPSRWLIRVPLFERDWRVPLKKELGVDWRLDPTHFTEYTVESFRAEMDEIGLEIVELQIHWGEIWCELRTPESR